MLIKNIKKLNGCLRDNVPCKFLCDIFNTKPYMMVCSLGYECGRGYCIYHLDDDREKQVKKIQKLLAEDDK